MSSKMCLYFLIGIVSVWLSLTFYRAHLHTDPVKYFLPQNTSSSDERPLAVIGILSNDEYRERRDTIRNTWIGTIKVLQRQLPFKIIYSFMLDKNTTATDEENNLHKDIVYLNVPEHGYANKFGRKLYVFLQYIHQTYPRADFGIRIDDDVFLCVPQIFKRLKELMSPNLYYGISFSARHKIGPIDEMFIVLGKQIINWVVNRTFCSSYPCNTNTLQDTGYGTTSLLNWIKDFKDIDFHNDNKRIKHLSIIHQNKDFIKHTTNPNYCKSNVVFHKVKISQTMYTMHHNNEILRAKLSKSNTSFP